jgi:cytidyltransferase-like protein
MKRVYVYGAFDDIRSRHVRFLEEGAKLGELYVLLWTDEATERLTGNRPKFPLPERKYFLESIRFVKVVTSTDALCGANTLPVDKVETSDVWVVSESDDDSSNREFCVSAGMEYVLIPNDSLKGFPSGDNVEECLGEARPKVVVTGCFDWLHTGHIRFFEEASAYGDLYVVVGHDANLRRLKGEGHPMFPQEERRYMAQSIRFVRRALISSGDGWLDAEPEIMRIKPDIYLVNEDGDRMEKREFCDKHGIRYVVLKRTPKDGLPRRESTQLRGF